ncbi:MAG: phage integrase N-terminal SAM-like domain-containing protein [Candidatus Cloacimonetes bacterium]|nr:phage integrase N-terminal SAM-like domain-containing protein [Candidatus Cloacimonadota bacterium]MCK4358612.1 phage integrase N-terminal SAM-like domain-containing protein [Candidatus Cloacimonadota bacterium]
MIINKTNIKRNPKLLELVRMMLLAKHYSIHTEESYINWIKRFILFHNKKHPKDMGEKEINKFLTHLAVNDHLSASTQNQALCAILFLYKFILKHTYIILYGILYPKTQNKYIFFIGENKFI